MAESNFQRLRRLLGLKGLKPESDSARIARRLAGPVESDAARIARRLAGEPAIKGLGRTAAADTAVAGEGIAAKLGLNTLGGAGKFALKGAGAVGTALVISDIISALEGDDNELDPSVLFGFDITKREKKRLAKELKAIQRSQQSDEIAGFLTRKEFGSPDKPLAAGPTRQDAIDLRAAQSLVPLAAITGKSASELIGEDSTDGSRVLNALTSKEEDEINRIIVKERRTTQDSVNDFLSGR